MPRVVHFEIGADNPERAVKFYAQVFGWKIDKWGPQDYWLVTTGPDSQPGINGGIVKRESPGISTVNSVEVPSIDEFVDKATSEGGRVVMPKTPVPGVGYVAYCQDTEGNMFGLFQSDAPVKT
ncbi:MAG: VOC family protein [Chloroflexi bacterium]|nr:VOC family protein [Chloroflexota bacterium]